VKRILVLLGPNLNLLGSREPEIYGRRTLEEISRDLQAQGRGLGLEVEVFQSNHEGMLVDRIQEASDRYGGILLNPGGLSHTSVALRDAVAACSLPVVLVHLSNTWAREPFRRRELVGAVCTGGILGLGELGFQAGLWVLARLVGAQPGRNANAEGGEHGHHG
jgi:3-dehydroquinate dehydratase-2